MPFYEVIYEPGDFSVVQADSDDEVIAAVANQHQRAKSGLPGGPAGHRADRVARVLKYDEHPGDDKHVTDLDEKQIKARLAEVLADPDFDISAEDSLSQAAARLVPPVVLDTPPHESNFAYKETGELDPSSWGGEGSQG